jgi:hypothetical protein
LTKRAAEEREAHDDRNDKTRVILNGP